MLTNASLPWRNAALSGASGVYGLERARFGTKHRAGVRFGTGAAMRSRDGGLYLARARAEGRKALAIARTTDSQVTARELTTLTTALRTDNNEHT